MGVIQVKLELPKGGIIAISTAIILMFLFLGIIFYEIYHINKKLGTTINNTQISQSELSTQNSIIINK